MRKLGPLVVSLLLVACGDDANMTNADVAATTTTADVSSDTSAGAQQIAAGEALMWRAFSGEVAVRQQAIDALEAGVALEPDHPRGNLLLGMTLLSAVAEDNNLGAAFRAINVLEHAIAVSPDDLRIPGWLGTVKVPIARFTGTGDALQDACDDMIAAADAYPEFNNVNLAIAFAKLPLDSGYPRMAIDRLEAIQGCGDLSVCQNTTLAPHNVQGALMLYGDVHARVGERDEALAYYDQALASDGAAN